MATPDNLRAGEAAYKAAYRSGTVTPHLLEEHRRYIAFLRAEQPKAKSKPPFPSKPRRAPGGAGMDHDQEFMFDATFTASQIRAARASLPLAPRAEPRHSPLWREAQGGRTTRTARSA